MLTNYQPWSGGQSSPCGRGRGNETQAQTTESVCYDCWQLDHLFGADMFAGDY